MVEFGKGMVEYCKDQVLEKHRFLYYASQLYERVDNLYIPVEDNLVEHYFDAEAEAYMKDEAKTITAHQRNELVAYIKAHAMRTKSEISLFLAEGLLGFLNGFISLEELRSTGTIKLHDYAEQPDAIFFTRIPHELNLSLLEKHPGITEPEPLLSFLAPTIHNFFSDTVGSQNMKLQLFKIAYCFHPKNPYKLMFMELGEKNAGKTTYITLVEKILGERNFTSQTLQQIAINRFALEGFRHKLANICDDLSPRLVKDIGMLKMLTGESTLPGDRKFRESLPFKCYAKNFFAANKLPALAYEDEAFYSRWIITNYPNEFAKSDFKDKMLNDEVQLQGVILASIYALRELLNANPFNVDYTSYAEKWKRQNNSIYAFIKEKLESKVLVLNPDMKIQKEELYQIYTEVMEDTDAQAATKTFFTQELQRLFSINPNAFIQQDGRQARAYKGIGLASTPTTQPQQKITDTAQHELELQQIKTDLADGLILGHDFEAAPEWARAELRSLANLGVIYEPRNKYWKYVNREGYVDEGNSFI